MAPVKERMKKSREKMKNDPDKWQKHLEKERSRDKIRRAEHKKIMKNSLYEMVENRKRVRDRVRAFRLRKQMAAEGNVEPPESPIGSYKCVQSFGKAVNRTKRTLPESPHKKTAVLKKLVQDIIGPEVFVQISPRKKPSTQITDEVKNTVIEFFCQDDISRQTPGIKDCVIVRKKGEGKIKYQKRYMVMTIGEAYQEFKKSHPDINIGKSTLFSLRPPYIIRVGDTPHDVCICKYHFNVINLVECIGKVIPTFPQDETPLNVRKRLKFHDVYSSSEDSDPDEVLSAPLPSQIKGRPTKIEKLDVKSGSFFLVKVASDVKKGAPSSIEYKYIAVCQNELDEEGDVKVMFLRSVSQKKNVFKADDDDVAFVKLEQLVCKLPDPDVKPQGNRLYYQFQSAVGVVEK